MPHLPYLPTDAGVRHTPAIDPAIGPALLALPSPDGCRPAPLSPGGRQLLAADVSAPNLCRHGHDVHAETAHRFGVDANRQRPVDGPKSGASAEEPRPLSALAPAADLRARAQRADIAAVSADGWDEMAVHHAIHTIAMLRCRNRRREGRGNDGIAAVFAKRGRQLLATGSDAVPLWRKPRDERGGSGSA